MSSDSQDSHKEIIQHCVSTSGEYSGTVNLEKTFIYDLFFPIETTCVRLLSSLSANVAAVVTFVTCSVAETIQKCAVR